MLAQERLFSPIMHFLYTGLESDSVFLHEPITFLAHASHVLPFFYRVLLIVLLCSYCSLDQISPLTS